jgi:hypothetical protein
VFVVALVFVGLFGVCGFVTVCADVDVFLLTTAPEIL